jgi:uncharacterized SAM-binding protein YcdF (DUF218 family)
MVMVAYLSYEVFAHPRQMLTVDSGPVKADFLVVLGGGRDERPQRAAKLFFEGEAPRILVSGAGDCEANVQMLEKNGVPENAIFREARSMSTFENAKFSVQLLRQMNARRVIVVTSWFHSRRAYTCFEHFAPDMQIYSRPSYLEYTPTAANHREVNGYIKFEYIKMLIYWVWHGVCPLYIY